MIVAATWDVDDLGRAGCELVGAANRLGAALGGEGAVASLAALARELNARAVLLPADEQGGEVAPRLAERLAGTAVTHALAVEAADGRPVWTRPVFGGKALATVMATVEPVVATLRRGAFDPAE